MLIHICHPIVTHGSYSGQSGHYTSFADCLKARLNLLSTRSTLQKMKRLSSGVPVNCRKCNLQPKTLSHVLNACMPNEG